MLAAGFAYGFGQLPFIVPFTGHRCEPVLIFITCNRSLYNLVTLINLFTPVIHVNYIQHTPVIPKCIDIGGSNIHYKVSEHCE